MLFTADGFTAFLQTLGLTQGLFKPIPSVLDSTRDAVHTVVGAINETTAVLGLPLPNVKGIPLLGSLQDQDGHEKPAIVKSYAKVKAMNTDNTACHVSPYDASLDDIVTAPFDSAKANVFRYRQQQAVNLGSWFVHEKWMTPSVFACAVGKQASELDIASGYGSPENARAVLERHWDTFISRSDFEYLAFIGINTVRLPIGYWSLGPVYCKGTDFEPVADVYQNSWPRVLRAINWAAEFGIGVIVDLHGAPGSQNGQTHSGISDGKTNLFNDEYNAGRTIGVLTFLTQQLDAVTNVVGIQILNEPANVPQLTSFYDRAIAAMRQVSPQAQSLPLYVHDGFDLDRFSQYIAGRTDFVVHDYHSYFVFTPQDNAKPAHSHTADIATKTSDSLAQASAQERRNLIVGEWSCALTPDSLEKEDDEDDARKQFCTGQMEVYTNDAAGWAFWSYTLESPDQGWSFKAAVGKSLPSTFFSYGQNGMHGDTQKLLSLAVAIADMKVRPTPPMQSSPAKRELPLHRHRLASIHERRQLAAVPSAPGSLGGSRPEYDKGYSDGFVTAKLFAANGLSKLGFIDQYINDSMAALGVAVVSKENEGFYRGGFIDGLRDAERLVQKSLDEDPLSPPPPL